MRLRRSKQPAAAPDQEAVDLSGVPTPALWFEMQRRGFEALPAGALETTVGELQARAKEAEAYAAELEAEFRKREPVVRELGELAGKGLPKAVARVRELSDENRELQDQARRSEQHVSMLAQALVGEEFSDHIGDGPDE